MRSSTSFLALSLLSFVEFGIIAKSLGQAPAPVQKDAPVQLKVTAKKKTYQQLEPIRLTVESFNNSDHFVDQDNNTNNESRPFTKYQVKVTRQGKEVPRTAHFDNISIVGIHTGGSGTFGRGAKGRDTLVANLFCDMTVPGRYQVHVSMLYDDLIDGQNGGKPERCIAVAEPVEIKVISLPDDREDP